MCAEPGAAVGLPIALGDLGGPSDRPHAALVQQHGAIAQALHGAHVVGHQEDRAPFTPQPLEALVALLLKGGVAHGQHLVDQQDVGVHLHGHGERQPHAHPRRVVLELQVDELLEVTEGDDVGEALAHFAATEAQQHPVHQHVVAAGQLGVEPHPHLHERRQAPAYGGAAGVGVVDAGQALEQRALAAAVATHDPEALAAGDLERNLVERLQRVDGLAAQPLHQALLDGRVALVGNQEALVEPVCRHRHGRAGLPVRGRGASGGCEIRGCDRATIEERSPASRAPLAGSYTRAVPEASALALAVHRLVLRTQQGVLRHVWLAAHHLVLRAVVKLVVGGDEATTYLRAGFGYRDVIYGLSDLDVSIVADDPGTCARARQRWRWLSRNVPGLGHLVHLAVYERAELALAASAPSLDAREAVHLRPHPPHDEAYLRMRPGLFGPLCDWRLAAGHERRPVLPAQNADSRRTAAWLELQRWWREAFYACAHPGGPRLPYVCVKLVAEPARIWLWLARGERVEGRRQVLERALRELPEEQAPLTAALDLHRSLTRSPPAPLAEALAAFVRLSNRIAGWLAEELRDRGTTTVRLDWGAEDELVLADRAPERLAALGGGDPALLPLCDWKARTWPGFADDAFAPLAIDLTDPGALGGAALAAGDYGPYAGIRSDRLLVLPGPGLMRAVQCELTDPVSFALMAGHDRAHFVEVPGWSAADSSRRAVMEHRAWLGIDREGARPAVTEWMEAQARTALAGGETLGRLLTAAQAGLLAASLDAGDPELALTTAAVARRLGAERATSSAVAEEAYRSYRRWRRNGGPVPERLVWALRDLVCDLPAYAASR